MFCVMVIRSLTRSLFLCPYTESGSCALEKNLFQFRAEQGGTTKVERHTKSHENGLNKVQFRRQLPVTFCSTVDHTAALAVVSDEKTHRNTSEYNKTHQTLHRCYVLGSEPPLVQERIVV